MQLQLNFNIKSYWHIGSGEEGGSYADALVLKDANGLPYVPGKSIKGLFKDAFEKAAEAKWFSADLVTILFGQESKDGITHESVIRFSSAVLSESEVVFFNNSHSAGERKSTLYKVIQSTKININGVAAEGSFRAIEVAVPMTLTAYVELNVHHPKYHEVLTLLNNTPEQSLKHVARLISGLGAQRQRGLGAVCVNVMNTQGAAQ